MMVGFMSRLLILGIPISCDQLDEIVSRCAGSVARLAPRTVITCANPHSIIIGRKDALMRAALSEATYNLPDGVGTMLAARLLGRRIDRRITGWDLFTRLMHTLNAAGGARVLFLGSSPRVLSLIQQRATRDFPRLTICDVISPPFTDWDESTNSHLLARIEAARPDVLWVGMTAPKQEKWVQVNAVRLTVPVVASIGAVFDFYAGTVPRAPGWLRHMGFEWAFRLGHSPGKVWQRSFISAPLFLGLLIREWWTMR
jgi:N-acetylglucosaminyldiphosphoundecaprenol N-acetyl-beta-D-mannosaminyltransferase